MFFKQKTAYELRISDWSSDVCSSDLDEDRHDVLVVGQAHHEAQGLAEAAAARQLVDAQGIESAIGREHQQLVRRLRADHEALPVAFLVLDVGDVLDRKSVV